MVVMVTIIITETLIAFIIIFISVINFVIIIGQFIISCTSLSFKPAEGYMRRVGSKILLGQLI